jgi:hypothetical protein
MSSKSTETDTISAEMDYAQHEATWGLFTKMVKWGIIISVVAILILYFVINP